MALSNWLDIEYRKRNFSAINYAAVATMSSRVQSCCSTNAPSKCSALCSTAIKLRVSVIILIISTTCHAPDGYFFIGRGANVVHDAGVKVPIRGRDTPDM